MRYRLSDEDRERLGLKQEWVEFSADGLMMTEAEELENAGYDPEDFLDDVRGRPVVDADGSPVMVPVLDDDGNPVLDADGQPEMAQKRRYPLRQARAAAWIALRRAGVKVPYREFDFNITAARVEQDVAPPVGKGEEAAPASAKNGRTTRSRSRSTSGSSRGRSTG